MAKHYVVNDNIIPSSSSYTIGTASARFNSLFIGNTIDYNGDLYFKNNGTDSFTINSNGDLSISGNLTVLGTSSSISTQNLTVEDPIILLSSTQSGTPLLDSGFFIRRGSGATQGFIWDESDDIFSFIETNDGDTVLGNVNISNYSSIRAATASLSGLKLTTSPTNGYTLTSDSSGNATWQNNIKDQSTGLITGGTLSIGSPNTKFSISDGTGIVVNNSVTPPTISRVSWSGLTNLTPTYLNTNLVSYVAIDSNGSVIQSSIPFTNIQSRQYIFLGSLIHVNLTNLDNINNFQHSVIDVASQVHDLSDAIGIFNVYGNIFSANGSNLNLNKSIGSVHKVGSNWAVDVRDPNTTTLASLTALTFQYRFQNGNNGTTGISIDPNNYDLNGATTSVPTNKFTIQRIYSFVSNNVKIQYGQTYYTSLAEAKAAIQNEVFVTEQSIQQNGLLRAFLIVKQGATSLNNTSDAFLLDAGKFGQTTGIGGQSVSSLQNAYGNSINPEIVTDSTRLGVTIKRGSSSDSDTLLELVNGSDVTNFVANGNGQVGIGTSSVYSTTKLFVNATQSGTAFRLVDTTQGSGKYLKSDSLGNATWDIISGNGVTASGTTNYISKFTGTNTLGNSNIQDDGTTVTITGNLTVTGTSTTVNTVNLTVQDPIILLSSTQSGSPLLDSGILVRRGTGATQGLIWDESDDVFAFISTDDGDGVLGNVAISGYSALRVGNIGVATQSDSTYKINLSGNQRITGNFYTSPTTITINDSWYSIFAVNTSGANGMLFLDSSSSNASTSADHRMRITAQNNGAYIVGYGSSGASQTRFVLDGAASTNRLILNANNGTDYTYFRGNGSALVYASNPSFDLFNVRLDDTSTDTNGTYNALSIINADTTSNNMGIIGFSDSEGGSRSAIIATRFKNHTTKAGDLLFYTNTGAGVTQKMVIDSNGYFAFNGNTQSTHLYYFENAPGTTLGALKVYHSPGLGGTTAVDFSSVVANLRFWTDNNWWQLGTSNDYPLYLAQNGSAFLSISSSGGNQFSRIGLVNQPNASVTAKVKIISHNADVLNLWSPNTSATNLYFSRSDGNGSEQPMGKVYSTGAGTGAASTGQVELYGYANSTYNFGLVVNKDGNVGVGTNSPTAEFHTKGTQSTSGTYAAKFDNSSNSPLLYITNDTKVGIGLTAPSANLHVKGNTSSTVFKVDGTSGELFTITDSLVGSLFSVNDISGLPVLEAFSDNTVLLGDYAAPALYSTTKITTTQSQTDIYSIATASYTGVFYDYTIVNGSNARAGTVTAVWLSGSIQYDEVSTLDIGTTSGFTFSVVASGTYSVLRSNASSNGWVVKTIIRSI